MEQPLPPQFDFVFGKWAQEIKADPALAKEQPYKGIPLGNDNDHGRGSHLIEPPTSRLRLASGASTHISRSRVAHPLGVADRSGAAGEELCPRPSWVSRARRSLSSMSTWPARGCQPVWTPHRCSAMAPGNARCIADLRNQRYS